MQNQTPSSNQDFGANLGTFLVCAAALVMLITTVQNPTPGAIAITAVLSICGIALIVWRLKVRNQNN